MVTSSVPVTKPQSAVSRTPDVWQSFRGEMDRLFDRFTSSFGMTPFPAFGSTGSAGFAAPAVDITESDGAFKVSAELPGMNEKDVEVAFSDGRLSIKGEKREEKIEEDKGYHLSERSYGQFQRSFILPDNIDSDKIEAGFTNGVLTITIPKKQESQPKKIEVKTAA